MSISQPNETLENWPKENITIPPTAAVSAGTLVGNTAGYDGHSLRAYYYFSSEITGVDPNYVLSINTIQKNYKPLRNRSKAPTFALTYQGTFRTLMTKCGFSEAQAKEIEKRYHELYAVSTQWVNDKLDEAMSRGYIIGAFGLRLRTPLLKQVIRGTRVTPKEAEAEGRTAGNALGQSWGLLNNRAVSEFMGKVRTGEHRLNIRPCAQIHDANYYIVRATPEVILYFNEHLTHAVKWQDHPDIAHPTVKLGGKAALYYPNWANEVELPLDLNKTRLQKIVQDVKEKFTSFS